jgi:hypothetical protein
MSKKDPLKDKLAKFKSKTIHDRLAGKDTNKDNIKITSKVNDRDTSKDNIDDTITSKVDGKDTNKDTININDDVKSDFTSEGKSTSENNINDASNIEGKVDDNDKFNNIPIPEPPKLAREAKKAVTYYIDKDVHARFEQYIKDQIKTKKLRSSKVKSYYAEAAIDFFLKSQGY